MLSAQTIHQELHQERVQLRWDIILTSLTALGLIIGFTAQIAQAQPRIITLGFALSFVAGGTPAFWSAFKELARGRLDIDLLMVTAALAAAAVGEARDGAILLFLFSLASTLEAYALGNTKRALAALMALRPDEANLLGEQGQIQRLSVERLRLGDVVLVKPGERIPVDATIQKGLSSIDQSTVTGESVPVDKTVGDSVFAATVNGHGVLELRVTKLASESTLARMIDLVTQAQSQRSPSERFSEWFGQRYTILVLVGSIAALLVFLLLGLSQEQAFYKAATLLVVASPCAIVISVPAAVLSALAASARKGVLFKGGAALEDFGTIDTLAVDKTGTLTTGKMRVAQVLSFTDEHRLLQIAATLEAQSEHPLAKSILEFTEQQGVQPLEAQHAVAIPGKGLNANLGGVQIWAGNSAMLREKNIPIDKTLREGLATFEQKGLTPVIIGDSRVLGLIGVADTVRERAKDALTQLYKEGVNRVVMLTGDHPAVAKAVAAQLDIAPEHVYAELLPEDKVQQIKRLSESARVAFVGDGVNDAAALATAHVGIAMGAAGTDVALEAADVALLSDDLSQLPGAYVLARRANQIIRQNLAFALGIMVLMVIITVFWHLPLPLGVLGHEGGTLLVVANGLRLLWQRQL